MLTDNTLAIDNVLNFNKYFVSHILSFFLLSANKIVCGQMFTFFFTDVSLVCQQSVE